MADLHRNFATSTVATAPSPATSGTSLVVAAGEGSRFPTAPFNATIHPIDALPTPANAEVVRVTGISTDTLTITRAQESSSARTVIVGDRIYAAITAKSLEDIEGDADMNPVLTGAVASPPVSTTVGVAETWYAVKVLMPMNAGMNSVRYRVGDNSAGTVTAGLYHPSTTKVADLATPAAQAAAYNTHIVTFDVGYAAPPGEYWAAVWFSSAAATFVGARMLVPVATGTNAGGLPSTLGSTGSTNADRPIMTVHG